MSSVDPRWVGRGDLPHMLTGGAARQVACELQT